MRQFPASPITALIDSTPRYNLGESMGRDLTVAELLGPEDLATLAGAGLGYGTSAGDPGLRAQVAARHGIASDQVLITAGAAAALFLAGLLCGDGEIVVGLPCYPPMLSALRGIGAALVTVQSQFGDGYRIDLGAFSAALSPRTQLAMFASPQNPSGVAITPGEAEQMLAAMSRTCPGALLLIDETYREATYGDAPAAGTFAGLSPQLLTCASLAKAFGTPGLRIGWLTVPGRDLYEQFRLAKFNTSLACGTLDELLATKLLARAGEVLAQRAAVLADARGIVERWIKAHTGRLDWLRPQAGAFCCMRLHPDSFGPAAVDRFHRRLAEQGTLVAPGPWFHDSAQVFRVGLAYGPAAILQQGLDIIGEALEAG